MFSQSVLVMKAFFALTAVLLLGRAWARSPVRALPDARCPRFDDPEEIILLPHLSDCSKFVTCLSGLGYEMNCPEGLEYSIAHTTCDYPEYAQCHILQREKIQIASNWLDILQVPQKPNLELSQNWEAVPAVTEPELESVPLEGNDEAPSESIGTSGGLDSRCPQFDHPRMPVLLAVSGSCSTFMKCFAGRTYVMNCPAGLEFNVKTKECDYPDRAKCTI